MSFGENFKTARMRAGLTQQQVADAIGLDRTAIAHYENNDSMPKPRNLNRLCELFDISLSDLLKQ